MIAIELIRHKIAVNMPFKEILFSVILELETEGDQYNKKGIAIENGDLRSELPHHLPWFRLHQQKLQHHCGTSL